jgi:hypothetical protein
MVVLKNKPPICRPGIHPAGKSIVYRAGHPDLTWEGPWTNVIHLLVDKAKTSGAVAAATINDIERKMKHAHAASLETWKATWRPLEM